MNSFKLRRLALACFLPLIYSFIQLWKLGFFDGGRVGVGGSDFYPAAAVARFVLKYPFFLPERLPDFFYPDGELTASLPEFFSEPLWQMLVRINLYIKPDPLWALWFGMVQTALFNTWGTFAIFYHRYRNRSLAGVLLGWALIATSPWIWSRNTFQWLLGWAPIFLFCITLWWDLFLNKKPMRPWIAIPAHALLIGQSIYYGVFLILLVTVWGVFHIFRMRDRVWRSSLLRAIAFAFIGYAAMAGFSAFRFQAIQNIHVSLKETDRPLEQLHIYSIRMREMTKGGAESLWNQWVKPKHGSRDEEGFPAPLPKLLLIGAFLMTLALRPLGGRGPSRLMALGIVWFLICGLQEIPWIRETLLHRLFPFIRAYARIMMPITLLSGLWLASIWPKMRSRWEVLTITAGLILLQIDYGPPQLAFGLTPDIPCGQLLDRVHSEGLPVFLHQAVHFHKLYCGGISEFAFYAIAGQPLVTRPWIKPVVPLLIKTSECDEWRPRVKRAVDRAGAVLWWYEGTRMGWEASKKCLTGYGIEPVLKEAGLIVSRLRLKPEDTSAASSHP